MFVIAAIVLVALVLGSIFDIRTREVPDWLNYSLIFIGLGVRAIYSAVESDWMFLAYGLVGLAAFVIVALAMFYTGVWGGGDSKLLMGIGALIGMEFSTDSFLLVFLVNLFAAGAVYGFFWVLMMAFKHRKKLFEECRKLLAQKANRIVRCVLIALLFISMLSTLLVREIGLKIIILALAIIFFMTYYLWVFVKSVENISMLKFIQPNKLTEGDWIAKDIVVKGKTICGPKDLGISKEQIAQLIKLKVKNVLVKEGVPFVPSFLLGFIASLLWGAWWLRFF